MVVGYDGRHRSAEFAADAAGVLAAAGFSVLLAPGPLPTPVTAFAVRQLGAAAGVQVTASHNPPQDNGLKVYLAQGAQLVSPEDARIERGHRRRPAAPAVIDADGRPAAVAGRSWCRPTWTGPAQLAESTAAAAPAVRVAITPMHGVGGETAVKALHLAGFTDVHVVAEQAAPDGDFPTVPFPNPEEHGRDRPAAARWPSGSAPGIAIALDPDADRCALGDPAARRRLADADRRRDRRAARRSRAAHTGPRRPPGSAGGHHHRLRASCCGRSPRRTAPGTTRP